MRGRSINPCLQFCPSIENLHVRPDVCATHVEAWFLIMKWDCRRVKESSRQGFLSNTISFYHLSCSLYIPGSWYQQVWQSALVDYRWHRRLRHVKLWMQVEKAILNWPWLFLLTRAARCLLPEVLMAQLRFGKQRMCDKAHVFQPIEDCIMDACLVFRLESLLKFALLPIWLG